MISNKTKIVGLIGNPISHSLSPKLHNYLLQKYQIDGVYLPFHIKHDDDIAGVIKTFADLGSNILTVHYEACTHLHRTIQEIKDNGMKAGVAINPHTKVDLLSDIISDIDLVCVMSVNPGFGGQSFIESTYRKVSRLKQIITNANSNCKIEIDGGVSDKNAKKLLEKGADVLVAGNHVFKSKNPTETIAKLKNL